MQTNYLMSVFLFLFSLLAQSRTYCSCVPLGPIDDRQYNEYSLIVKGKVVKISVNDVDRTIYLSVDTYYKGGGNRSRVKITTPKQVGMCGIIPKIGEHWLVFAYADEVNYKTSLCTRTKNMNPKAWNYNKDEIDKDIKFLAGKSAGGNK